MKDELTRLVEDAEHALACDVAGCARCFRNGESTFDERKALASFCSAVRELDAENRAASEVAIGALGRVSPESVAQYASAPLPNIIHILDACVAGELIRGETIDAERTRLLEAVSALVVDWKGIAATSAGVNSDGYRDGLRACAKALEKLLPPTTTEP